MKLRTYIRSRSLLAAVALFGLAIAAFASLQVEAYIYQQHLTNVAKATAKLPQYGIAGGNWSYPVNTNQLDTFFQDLNGLGAGWIRFDFDWNQIQPTSASTYNWSDFDQIVATAAKYHVHVLGIVDFTPAWARPANCQDNKQCAPANPNLYAHFAQVLAQRYKAQGVNTWEIWNEPNISAFWQPTPNTSSYAALLKAAYTSIHQVEPSAIVLSGGLAPADNSSTSISPVSFLQGLYQHAAGQSFDAVADHPYTFPLTPTSPGDQAWAQMSQGANSLRSIMIANHDTAKKIWVTEFGAPTNGPGPAADIGGAGLGQNPQYVTPALQSQMIDQAIQLFKNYSWSGPFLLYTYQDPGTDPTNSQDFFGITQADGTPKPAYSVVQHDFSFK